MSWETTEPIAPATGDDAWGAAAAATTNGDGHAAPSGDDAWGATDGANGEAETSAPADMTKEERQVKAKEYGWTEAVPFDYAEYQRTGGNDRDFMGAGKVYEWNGEMGDIAPRAEKLEEVLFGGEFRMRKGEHIGALDVSVILEGPTKIEPCKTFEGAGLHPVILENLKLAQYNQPTPIQRYTLPAIIQGNDVLAVAQTGSGKTAAYMIPILSKLMGKAKKLAAPRPNTADPGYNPKLHGVRAEPLVVIVVPTRELAIQIFDEARRLCYRSMLRPCVAYGGLPMGIMRDQLAGGCDILIATPGRLCDVMDKPHILTMSRVKFTVVDEADEMLEQDWSDELTKIMAGGDSNEDADHVYIMTSATFKRDLRKLANEYLSEDFVRIRVGQTISAHRNIRQNIIWVDKDQKREAVYDLLFNMEPARTMIFCNAKGAVDNLDDFLYNRGLPTTSIHSDRNQLEREDAMRAFRTGKAPILIATGVSARGWDVKDCKHVINYDLPSAMHGGITEYIHRIGRTARIGNQGLATSFYNERDEELAQDLVNVLVDCDCEVPEFLQHLVPEGGKVDFHDDSDDEEEAAGEGGFGGGVAADGEGASAGAWGAAPTEAESVSAPGWGAAPTEGADAGFSAASADAGW